MRRKLTQKMDRMDGNYESEDQRIQDHNTTESVMGKMHVDCTMIPDKMTTFNQITPTEIKTQ